MGKYKIVFTDIDDTLNPINHKVSTYTKDIIKRVKKLGVKIVANTGRGTTYAIRKSQEAGLSEYVVSSNGSEIYNYKTNEKIFARNIPKDTVKQVYEYCNGHDMKIILNSFTNRFMNIEKYDYNDDPAVYFDDIDKILAENEINQIIVLSKNYERMLVLPNVFLDKFPNLKTVHSSIALMEKTPVPNKEYYHDLVLENTSKGTGIVELLDYFNIKPEEAIAIGNGYDDLTMFDVVGTCVAVENANNLLRENATYVTDNTLNDGMAKALEKYILKENENEI